MNTDNNLIKNWCYRIVYLILAAIIPAYIAVLKKSGNKTTLSNTNFIIIIAGCLLVIVTQIGCVLSKDMMCQIIPTHLLILLYIVYVVSEALNIYQNRQIYDHNKVILSLLVVVLMMIWFVFS